MSDVLKHAYLHYINNMLLQILLANEKLEVLHISQFNLIDPDDLMSLPAVKLTGFYEDTDSAPIYELDVDMDIPDIGIQIQVAGSVAGISFKTAINISRVRMLAKALIKLPQETIYDLQVGLKEAPEIQIDIRADQSSISSVPVNRLLTSIINLVKSGIISLIRMFLVGRWVKPIPTNIMEDIANDMCSRYSEANALQLISSKESFTDSEKLQQNIETVSEFVADSLNTEVFASSTISELQRYLEYLMSPKKERKSPTALKDDGVVCFCLKTSTGIKRIRKSLSKHFRTNLKKEKNAWNCPCLPIQSHSPIVNLNTTRMNPEMLTGIIPVHEDSVNIMWSEFLRSIIGSVAFSKQMNHFYDNVIRATLRDALSYLDFLSDLQIVSLILPTPNDAPHLLLRSSEIDDETVYLFDCTFHSQNLYIEANVKGTYGISFEARIALSDISFDGELYLRAPERCIEDIKVRFKEVPDISFNLEILDVKAFGFNLGFLSSLLQGGIQIGFHTFGSLLISLMMVDKWLSIVPSMGHMDDAMIYCIAAQSLDYYEKVSLGLRCDGKDTKSMVKYLIRELISLNSAIRSTNSKLIDRSEALKEKWRGLAGEIQ